LIASNKGKYIYVAVPRTGTHTISDFLERRCSGRQIICWHAAAHRVRATRFGLWRRAFVFGFVRNPWERMLSAYAYQIRNAGRSAPPTVAYYQRHGKLPTFREYIMSGEFGMAEGGQWSYFCSKNDPLLLLVSYIGVFERFTDEMRRICRKARIARPGQLQHRNRSRGVNVKDYRLHYDDEMAEKVGRLDAEVIRAFGYSFDSTRPKVTWPAVAKAHRLVKAID